MKNYKYYLCLISLFITPFWLSAQDMTMLSAAQAKRAAGQYQEAILTYTQVIQSAPQYALAYAERGYCYENLKQYDEALEDLNEAILLGFADPLAYLNRGWSKYNVGRKDEACLDWRMAQQLGYQAAQEVLDKYCQ